MFSHLNLDELYGQERAEKIRAHLEKLNASLDCVDNFRVAALDNPAEQTEYDRIKQSGCCGDHDEEVEIDGRKFRIGCNYGH